MPRTNSEKDPLTQKSKYISYLLRHDKRVGEFVDENGFASLKQLNAIARKDGHILLTESNLIAVTENPNTKKRFEYEYRPIARGICGSSNFDQSKPDDKTIENATDKNRMIYIRALNGHSFSLKANIFDPFVLENASENQPVRFLYHATNSGTVDAILRYGLSPMTRQFVHMYEHRNQVKYDAKRNTLLRIGPITSETLKRVTLFRSKNGYILCPHVIPTELLHRD